MLHTVFSWKHRCTPHQLLRRILRSTFKKKVQYRFSQKSILIVSDVLLDHAPWSSDLDLYIEITRWVYFDIKFTRQGFENACWNREACRAIQQASSKHSLVYWISKDANIGISSLVTLQTYEYDVIIDFLCPFSVISDTIQKVQRRHMLWDR